MTRHPRKLHPPSEPDYADWRETLSEHPERLDAISLRDVPLMTMTFNVLWRMGRKTLGDVARMSMHEIRTTPNLGNKSAKDILLAIDQAEKSLTKGDQ